MEGIWEAAKGLIKTQMPPSNFHLWIEPLMMEPGPGGELLLACPNPFALRWVQSHYLKQIQQVLATMGNATMPVRLKLLTAPARTLCLPQVVQPPLPLPPGAKA